MKRKGLVILAVVVLFFISMVPNVKAGQDIETRFREGDMDVYDPGLLKVLEEDTEEVEVIIQFSDCITSMDKKALEHIGMDVRHSFHVIPAVYAVGSSAEVMRLKNWPNVKRVEYNARLQWEMEVSTNAINATETWYTDVVDERGKNLGYIDGDGITAVVLDSGVDAGHPDLDYGEKTIMNLKSDTDFVWTEMENTDTSSGHGTHCAGTVAGNGDATAGARRGVAPGAKLIGLSTGEAVSIINALGALEWVYDHSRPDANPHNIRVVSNSWGSSGDFYSPENAIAQVTEMLTYENNVVVVFAAGNDDGDGTGYDDGGQAKPNTNPYANTPSSISVAAYERDGSGVAEFSSRGLKDRNDTFPDVGAPGVSIWSTAARRTMISTMTKQDVTNINPYYFAISGTSMATPHISGVVSLLWQACPEMRVSSVHDDYNGEVDGWFDNPNTRVHEAELILEASARFLPSTGDNGVPDNSTPGHWNMPADFAQGYGIVDVQRAVGIALTLHNLRTMDKDMDGVPDWPDATVKDAMDIYDKKGVKHGWLKYEATDTLKNSWQGEWTRFNNQTNKPDLWNTDQGHKLYIPAQASKMTVDLSYAPVSTEERFKAATINMVIDGNLDGTIDWTQSEGSPLQGNRKSELDLSGGSLSEYRGQYWNFNVEGRGLGLDILDVISPSGIGGEQYREVMIEYDVSVSITLDLSNTIELKGYARDNGLEEIREGIKGVVIKPSNMGAVVGQWEFGKPSREYNATGSHIAIHKEQYDLGRAVPEEDVEPHESAEETPWGLWLAAAILIAALLFSFYFRRRILAKLGR